MKPQQYNRGKPVIPPSASTWGVIRRLRVTICPKWLESQEGDRSREDTAVV